MGTRISFPQMDGEPATGYLAKAAELGWKRMLAFWKNQL
jgi:dienelactone hydrolase